MAISTELLGKDKSLEALKLLLEHFKEEYELTSEQILEIASGHTRKDGIPLAAFSNKTLSSLEIIVKYLKEDSDKTYHQIAIILNRDDRTIWSTYNSASKKQKNALKIKDTEATIPYTIFSSRKNSVLQSMVLYLKDDLGYSFRKISGILLKDYQTIYATYRNGKSKKNER